MLSLCLQSENVKLPIVRIPKKNRHRRVLFRKDSYKSLSISNLYALNESIEQKLFSLLVTIDPIVSDIHQAYPTITEAIRSSRDVRELQKVDLTIESFEQENLNLARQISLSNEIIRYIENKQSIGYCGLSFAAHCAEINRVRSQIKAEEDDIKELEKEIANIDKRIGIMRGKRTLICPESISSGTVAPRTARRLTRAPDEAKYSTKSDFVSNVFM